MGKYAVPEEIRKAKPKGTMVKNISGRYYVYRFKTVTVDGKRKTKMGACIGKIQAGVGFVPNDNHVAADELTTVDFGEWAVALANSGKTFAALKECFNPEDAARIYLAALIHFVRGFTPLKDIAEHYGTGLLALRFPGMKMGADSLAGLYDALGRRQRGVLEFERRRLAESSGVLAIDGHVVPGTSRESDLFEKGYKFEKFGMPQLNLLMAYDVNTLRPVLSRIYEGAATDKTSVPDFMGIADLKGLLLLMDRGFYSENVLAALEKNGNSWVIPLASHLGRCKKAVADLSMGGTFRYLEGRKATLVEFKDETIDGRRVLTFRDLSEALTERENYLRHLEMGDKGYTQEGYEANKDLLGVTVLQTNLENRTAREIFGLYKKRWKIETFYNGLKNRDGFHSLHGQSYYALQGLAFVMLASALIRREVADAAAGVKGMTVDDILLRARMVKANKRRGRWEVCNCLKKRLSLFQQLDTPLEVQEAHT